MRSKEIILDTLSCENGPDGIIRAGFRIFQEFKIKITFIGNKKTIETYIRNANLNTEYFNIIHTNNFIAMDDTPTKVLSETSRNSIQLAMQYHKRTPYSAIISAGNTGAIVLSAKKELGLIKSIRRSALCQILPCRNSRYFLLIDVGASISATATDLFNWGLMGYVAAQNYLKTEHPKVALLNVGSESNKGGRRLIRAGKLLAQSDVNFIGNVEGYDLWEGKADVVLTNGFTGNILLKSSESLVKLFMMYDTKNDIKLKHFLPKQYSGSLLLGINGICVVCHGKSDENELYFGIKRAIWSINSNVIGQIDRFIFRLNEKQPWRLK